MHYDLLINEENLIHLHWFNQVYLIKFRLEIGYQKYHIR